MKLPFLRRNDAKPPTPLIALHIDDSQWVRIPASVILRRHFGIRVLEASNGVDGLSLAIKEQPDLIILDVMMPQMDGFDVLVKLKEHPATKSIPVLMCTARDVNMAVKLGVAGYLIKPIDEEQLITKVGDILKTIARAGAASAHAIAQPRPADHKTDLVIPAPEKRMRPRCGSSLAFIDRYDAWYCHSCRCYPDYSEPHGT